MKGGGGKRENAGRPTKKFTVREGEQFYVPYVTGGRGLLTAVSMDRKHLTLRFDNGEEITLVR